MNDPILSLEQAAMQRWQNGDPWGFVELSAEDILYVDPGLDKPILDQQAYRAYMSKIEGKVHYHVSEFIDPRVVIVGEAALLTYNYRSSVLAPDGSTSSQTSWNATEVYFRQNSNWQISHTHWSYLHHTLPASLEIPIPIQMGRREYPGVLGKLMVLESAAMQRWRQGDPWGFIEISAPEVTYFDTGTPQRINGRDALRAEYVLREGKISYDVMDFVDPQIRVCGDMAVLFYRFLSTWLNPDGSIASRTPWNCSEVFQRIDGQWQIIHTHWSFIRGEKA